MLNGVVRTHAPVRVADCGGWTDTWFAGHGEVCHVAMEPGIEVVVGPGDPPIDEFLQACLAEAAPPFPDLAIDVVSTALPLGAAVGTSASLAVAVIAAVDALAGRTRSRPDLARAAHRVETVHLGQQSGIQDQIAAAYGGVNHIIMARYPVAEVVALHLGDAVREALARQLVTVYLNRPHSSSAMHQTVVDAMERGDRLEALEPMRASAAAAASALRTGDLWAYGAALIAHHEGSRRLHSGLVSSDADRVSSLASATGALGWKTNGAGGEGGSITVLTGADPTEFLSSVRELGFRVLDLQPATQGASASLVSGDN
jgi:D-glycero-alpha-D-manno-heptose-7-phosphate kinase